MIFHITQFSNPTAGQARCGLNASYVDARTGVEEIGRMRLRRFYNHSLKNEYLKFTNYHSLS